MHSIEKLRIIALYYAPHKRLGTLSPPKGWNAMAEAKKAAAKVKSEKKEYKTETTAKVQQAQWEKKGYKVARRKNVLYLTKA